MYLKFLDVQGFKSFPDKTRITFGNDITAIVGPNGSGKSNISDAILWVMGEQSTKTLRGAKMEDVIFGGTQKRAAVGFAEATLTLDNTDRALPYDHDEVMITRRYYRSGDSEYYINRQSARLRDIHELFMDTGLGREGYSNIGQGRIDEILSLKSADRREIFEEAAGISKYRHRKEETERKLAHTEDNLLRIGDKVSELELQLHPLKEQSEKAQKYLLLRDELQGVEVAVWMDRLEKLSQEARKAEEDYASAAFVLEQAQEEINTLYTDTENMGQQLRGFNEQVDNHRVQLSMLEGVRQQMQGQLAVYREVIRNHEQNILRNQEDLKNHEDRNSGIQSQLEQASFRVDSIEKALLENESRLRAYHEELSRMTADAQGITRQFIGLRERQVSLTADIAAREADLNTLSLTAAENDARQQQLAEDVRAGNARAEENGALLAQCSKDLQRAREEVTASRNTIAGYTLRQSTRQKRRDELAEIVRKMETDLERISAKARVFRAMEQDFEGYQKSVRLVMKEARRGALRNVYGPVSQLIRTEDTYTVAIEIALGMSMQNIVVQSESDGKAAIQFLKRTGGGRATFLPLSAVEGKELRENGLDSCRGFVGVASKLVDCEKTYRAVVDNLLGRTVIVEDLDAAIAMSKRYGNRFKIVTLDGQVINPGGSMTGGSVNKEAGILSRTNELEKLQQQEKTMTVRLEEQNGLLREAQRAADQVQYQLETAKEQLQEAEKQVLTLEGQQKQYEVLLQALGQAAESAQKELEDLQNRIRTGREQQAAVSAQIRVYQTELDKTVIEIEKLQSSQTEADQAVSGVTGRINSCQTEKAALEAERTSVRDHIADLKLLLAAADLERKKKLEDVDSIQTQISSTQEQIRSQQVLIEENLRQIQEAKEALDRAQSEYTALEARKSACERELQEKNKSIFNMQRACALLESKKQTTAVEERSIIDKLWDTYGLTPSTASQKCGQIESVAAATRRIAELKRKITSLGNPNLGAIDEYARVNERYLYLTTQRDDVLTSKRELEGIIRQITAQMRTIFVEEFARIDKYFGQVFQEMFGGGKGQLVLEDPNEPLTCGIEIRVQPPGKQVKTITLLSGGEKAFVAIALYFAILKVRPTPFCMLDEIDAALDDRNVERFASYLRNLSKHTQFIVITHRRGTMEASDVLYGVTMQEQGISKLLRLDLNQMEQQLGIVK